MLSSRNLTARLKKNIILCFSSCHWRLFDDLFLNFLPLFSPFSQVELAMSCFKALTFFVKTYCIYEEHCNWVDFQYPMVERVRRKILVMGMHFNIFKLSGDDNTWVAWSGIVGNTLEKKIEIRLWTDLSFRWQKSWFLSWKIEKYRVKCLVGIWPDLERSRKMEERRPVKLLLGRLGQLNLNFENKELT